MGSQHLWPDALGSVLAAAAIAPGNRSRFLAAGLLDPAGALVTDWASAFERLAPLEKATVRSAPGDFLAQAQDVVYRGKTSGTQASALTYFAGDAWNQRRLAARSRSLVWWGIDPTTPMLNLASRLSPVRPQDSSLVGPIDADFLVRLQQLLGPAPIVLRGYPSRLCEVAIALRQSQVMLQTESIVAVIATGECLFEFQRSLLYETFQAPVIDEYGCQETGISGLSCPEAGRLHLDDDRALYELIDGQLLTTDLSNTTMPMVRYSSGDRLHLYDDACPCGRPGLTAKVLGRATAAISIKGQWHWPGGIDLPRLPGVLAYQIRGDCLQLQTTENFTSADRLAIQAWFGATFGRKATIVEVPPFIGDRQSDQVDSTTWLHQVNTQPWSSWLNQPLPTGAAEPIAALLQALIAPRQIMMPGLPASTVEQIHLLAASPAADDPHIEALTIRVLLWGTGLMTDGKRTSSATQGLYQALITRFQQWVDRADLVDRPAAIGFDLLAPLLTMDRQTAQSLWPQVQALIHTHWPQGLKADAFTMHHYLNCLAQAGQNAALRGHPCLPALRPLSAVLLGDFLRFAGSLDATIVATWAEIIHACPGELTLSPTLKPNFRQTWQMLRQAWLKPDLQSDRAPITQLLSQLFDLAESPAQLAHCWLEKGYATLVLGDQLDPIAWVEILRSHIGLLSQSANPGTATNPLAWTPILNALAPQLPPPLAYACLFAAAPPNRHLSNFDRQTQNVNSKQSVITGNPNQ